MCATRLGHGYRYPHGATNLSEVRFTCRASASKEFTNVSATASPPTKYPPRILRAVFHPQRRRGGAIPGCIIEEKLAVLTLFARNVAEILSSGRSYVRLSVVRIHIGRTAFGHLRTLKRISTTQEPPSSLRGNTPALGCSAPPDGLSDNIGPKRGDFPIRHIIFHGFVLHAKLQHEPPACNITRRSSRHDLL